MSPLPNPRRVGVVAAALLLSACTENPVTVTPPEPLPVLSAMQCVVRVASEEMTCTVARPSSNANLDILYGGQDVYVKMSSSGVSYDSGTQIFQANVTLQNLLNTDIGTNDGTTMAGVSVFFASGPNTTGGTGTVTLANPTGTQTFTAGGQQYYLFPQIIAPLQISNPLNWQFNVPSTVATFSFSVLISAPVVGTATPAQRVDNTWTGSTDSDFNSGTNWTNGVPDGGESITIPSDSLFGGAMPVMDSTFTAAHVRVGYQSSLNQGGFDLTASGNVDVLGTIGNGLLTMTGSGALLRGNVGSLLVTGGTRLQGATRTSGAVNVTGALAVTNGSTLTVAIP